MRVGAAATDPVLLLGDVRELEVRRERAQHAGLAVDGQRRDRRGELAVLGPAAGRARERADALDVVEQVLARLLDEHAAEQVAEQADVAPEGRVGRLVRPDRHRSSVGRNRRKTEQSLGSTAIPR